MSATEYTAAVSTAVSTVVSTVVSASPETPPAAVASSTFSKLIPAAAPAVSPWGKAPSAANEKPAPPVLAKDSPLGASTTTKAKTVPAPKVKSTGKEKWIKYDAEIIISSSTGNKKKNGSNGATGNSGNNSGNSSNANTSNKKKQNGGKNQNQKKDQKKKAENNGVEKKHPTEKKIDANAEKLSSVVADLSISEPVETATRGQSTSPSSTPASSIVPVASAESKIDAGDKKQISQQHDSTHNVPHQNFKKYNHRHSEPYIAGNGGHYKRRYNDKGFNDTRHSIGGYGNMPVLSPNFNNFYMPMVPPTGYGFPSFPNGFSGQNSQIHSPNLDEFAALNSMPMGPIGSDNGLIPQFIPQQMMFTPYQQDPSALIVSTVAYYFSDENLTKDIFLRRNMNSSGFVPLNVLIGFNKLKSLTGGDKKLLLTALENYPEFEIVNDKIRRAVNWSVWVVAFDKRLPAGQDEDEKDEKENNDQTN